MAAAKKKPVRQEPLVDFYAFKDNGKYKDDIKVLLNGKTYIIQRGVHVKIPRKVYMVLKNSEKQDLSTANLIERKQAEYQAAVIAKAL